MHSDVAQTLLDIISVSSPNSPLLTQLANEDTMKLLFELMLSPTSGSSSAIHYGLSVLIGLIIPIGSLLDESDTEGDSDDEGEKQKAEVTMENLPAWIRLLLDKLADLKNVLLNPTVSSAVIGVLRVVLTHVTLERPTIQPAEWQLEESIRHGPHQDSGVHWCLVGLPIKARRQSHFGPRLGLSHHGAHQTPRLCSY